MSTPRELGIEVVDLDFGYGADRFRLQVDRLEIARGERAVLIGPSGCGKTSLLQLLAGILIPRAGHVAVHGQVLSRLADAERRRFRIDHIGQVFQGFELLEHLTVFDNVMLPYYINRAVRPTAAARQRARALLEATGLAALTARRPGKLSHGERQRVAICRALVTGPEVVLADEPTGNLDPRTARTVLRLLIDETARQGATLIVVTHDHSTLELFGQVVDFTRFVGEASA